MSKTSLSDTLTSDAAQDIYTDIGESVDDLFDEVDDFVDDVSDFLAVMMKMIVGASVKANI